MYLVTLRYENGANKNACTYVRSLPVKAATCMIAAELAIKLLALGEPKEVTVLNTAINI